MIRQQKETIGLNTGGWANRESCGSTAEPQVPTLSEVGIDKKLSMRSQQLAAMPESPNSPRRSVRWRSSGERRYGRRCIRRQVEQIVPAVSWTDGKLARSTRSNSPPRQRRSAVSQSKTSTATFPAPNPSATTCSRSPAPRSTRAWNWMRSRQCLPMSARRRSIRPHKILDGEHQIAAWQKAIDMAPKTAEGVCV